MYGSAWDQTGEAAARAGVSVRTLTGFADADAVRGVIDRIWGGQSLPRELIRAFQHAGTSLIGAEAEGSLVGFVLGFAGFSGGLHLHSHMLAVVPEFQSRGTGFALKLAQRAACLDHDVDEIRWTYDPLITRNAHLNLVKLGTEAIAFEPDFYGPMQDRQNQGDRSDRFEVRWRLSSDRVRRALAGEAVPPEAGQALLLAAGDPAAPEPGETGAAPTPGCTVTVPTRYQDLRDRDPALARRWREVAGRVFRPCFGAGLTATWIDRRGTYVFQSSEGLE